MVRVKTSNGTSLLAQHELPELATGGGIQSRVSHVIDMIHSNGQHSEAKNLWTDLLGQHQLPELGAQGGLRHRERQLEADAPLECRVQALGLAQTRR